MKARFYQRLLGMVFGLAGVVLSGSASAADVYKWVQYVPGGIEVRAVTEANACPLARIDGVDKAMGERSSPAENYPVRGCALAVPPEAKSLTIDGVPMVLPKANPQKIVVIGDTGCRMKGNKNQPCNDVVEWPYRLVAEVIASLKPDLVIHVGDYHYRETACPDGNGGCAGSPFGDTWAVWKADFFAPGENLLRTVPWVMTRGNHEECHRGGQGWSRTLEPYAFDTVKGCNTGGAPYVVTLPGLTLGVLDVATAEEDKIDPRQAAAFRAQMAALTPQLLGPSWLVFHRPVWGVAAIDKDKVMGSNATLASAWGNGVIPASVSLMLSGHYHTFQAYNYAADLPSQVVAGHGGDYLDAGVLKNPAGLVMNGVAVKSGMTDAQTFGFALFEKGSDSQWKLTNYNSHGTAVATCAVKHREITCAMSGG